MRCGRKLAQDGDVSVLQTRGAGRESCQDGAGCALWLWALHGRSLQYCWRWTGFNFGFDLLITYTNRYIIFKRNTLNQPCSGSVSLQPRRSIAFRYLPEHRTGLTRPSLLCCKEPLCGGRTGGR